MAQGAAINKGAVETGGNLDKQTLAAASIADILRASYLELRCIRLALTALATEGGRFKESEFDPEKIIDSTKFTL